MLQQANVAFPYYRTAYRMIIQTHQIENVWIYIWQSTESTAELWKNIPENDNLRQQLQTIGNEKRCREKLAVQCLLAEIFPNGYQLQYTASGKPYLKHPHKHLSISHSQDLVAIAIADQNVGIDIQHTDKRLINLQSRFVGTSEYIQPTHQLSHLLLHWCAKEAAFKYLDEQGVDFTKHLHVQPFNVASAGTFLVGEQKTTQQQTLTAHYQLLPDRAWVLVKPPFSK